MKKHFKPEDRTLGYQVFFFYKAMNMADIFGKLEDDDKRHIDKQWVEFTQEFQAFINSDYNRDDFEFSDCVIGYIQELLDKNDD